ncbi:hypothetical protein CLPU_3c02120 [Gottschalkia purinilytica]|uniref:bis(5'-nucleosyl)-tetraphosphatase (symmetrical) n=1 Tax=Gottschalkia purinilytica TaxID=1503 RepID=A0A0L0WD82_GOTPU|nr:bis(5'-nucleosyl)-tetraphosphatase (symmetrical) YqeK [Gottschalkia purinilytica]KNF09433.1 hypothetical protein CLPU_3c02120 [Gottschalkia purinilytica]
MIKKIKEDLEKSIGKDRYLHSLRVMEVSQKLAKCYGENEEDAMLAGLLHDCGRILDKCYLLKMANEFGIILKGMYEKEFVLIHAYLGAEIAKNHYKIENTDIINAIKYHTTGRENMSLLEKIVYIADYIEPGRDFPGVEEIRDLAYKNLDKSLLKSMENTIRHVIDRGWILHEDTVKARNYIILNSKQ